jgi:hypothetical protein
MFHAKLLNLKDKKLNVTCSPFIYNCGLYQQKSNIKIHTKNRVFIGGDSIDRCLF